MKPTIYTFTILLLVGVIQPLLGQNWALIHTTALTNYRHVTPNTVSAWKYGVPQLASTSKVKPFKTLKIESSTVNGGETIHTFNTNSYIINSRLYAYRAHFLQRQMVDKGNGIYHCYNPDTFYIHTLAQLGETWEFNPITQDTATIDSVFQDTVLGVLDSIKKIELSSGTSFLLSKNHGIISFPDTNNSHYELAGIEYSPTTFVGIRMPNTHSVFDYEVGDVFVKELDVMNSSQYYLIKTTITGKQVQGTGYTYSIRKEQIYEYFYPGCPPYTATTTTTNISVTEGTSPQAGVDAVNGSLHHGNRLIEVYEDNMGRLYKHKLEIPLGPYLGDSTYQIYWQMYAFGLCAENFGIINEIEYGAEHKLVGFVKNGVVHGDTAVFSKYFPTSIENISSNSMGVSIHPQPAQQQVYIDLNNNNGSSPVYITIMNLAGQLIKEAKMDGTTPLALDIEALPQGIYLLKVEQEDRQGVEKLIISR